MRPLLPITDLAILSTTWDGVASRGLDERAGARLAGGAGEDHDLALPARLAALARLVAIVPSCPVGDDAIHLPGLGAGLGLLEVAGAGRAGAERVGLDPAVAVALVVPTAPTPGRPLAICAVLHVDDARALVAHPHLVKAILARRTTVLRMLKHLALAALETAIAGLLAHRPVAPLSQLAVLRGNGAALRGLVQACLARRAIEGGLLHDIPLAIPLADVPVQVARRPLGPVRDGAVPPVQVGLRALLGLAHVSVARLAAFIVLHGDVSAPLAEPCLRGLAPLAPGAELAIHGNARWSAWRCGLACTDVQLRALAHAAVPRREERALGRRGEAQRPAAHRHAGPAADAAARRRGPLRPGAVEARLTMSAALGHLFGTLEIAHAPAMVGHLVDGAVAVPLAVAARAVAPLGPVSPGAVEALLLHACVRVARGHGGQLRVAGPPPVARQREDPAPALPLASPAALGAAGPVAPEAQGAVGRAGEPAGVGGGLAGARAAGGHLLQRGHVALLAAAVREDLDVAVALVHSKACARAEGPLTPLGELAISVGNAGLHCACLVLVPDASCWPPACIGPKLHAPAPHSVSAATRSGAALPFLPLAPLAVDAILATLVCVAGRGLALRQSLAFGASVLWQRLDRTHPVSHTSATARGTRRPVVPQAPRAVCVGAHAVLAQARQGLLQRSLAAVAVQLLGVCYLPRARHGTLATFYRALRPLRPLLEVAVHTAGHGVACLQLPERALRALAAVPGRRLHGPRADGLAAAALLAAARRLWLPPAQRRPLAPLGEQARLLVRRGAALRLLQCLVAAPPNTHGVLLDLARPEALRVRLQVARRPAGPVAHDAVAALARRLVAGLRLQGHILASLATVARSVQDPAHASVPADAAGDTAGGPLLPVREEAGHGLAVPAAGHGLLRAASARLPAVFGRAQGSPAAEGLASGVHALAPLRPIGERAVLHLQQAVLRNVLHRLNLGA
mmetsp:Transcript_129935/g.315607  ORF Transcript_129935/g.315607 Transcript_129935/m.315607 type:complete len:970 (-) Transcript_129935:305-3214(-)